MINELTSPLEKEDVCCGHVSDLVARDLVLGDGAVVEVVPLAGGHVAAEGRVVAAAHRAVVVDRRVEVEQRPAVSGGLIGGLGGGCGGRAGGGWRGRRGQAGAGEEGGHVEAGEGELHGLLQLQGV